MRGSERRGRLGAAFVLFLALASCAQDVPGAAPPPDQLHFPVGLAVLRGSMPARDRLLVGSSNFDQRFNAGSLTALSIDGLFDLVPPAAPDVVFEEEFRGVSMSRVRVLQFGGDLLAVPADALGAFRVFVASRGHDRLTMVEAEDGALNCSTPGIEPISPTDCTEGFVVRTGFDDPFALAFSPEASALGVIAIGHLGTRPSADALVSGIGIVDLGRLMERVDAERRRSPLSEVVDTLQFSEFAGVTGLAFVSGAVSGGDRGTFVATSRVATPGRGAMLTALDVTALDGEPTLDLGASLSLGSLARAEEMRSLAISDDGTRAYVSVRFTGPGNVFSSGIAVVAVEEGALRLLSIYEIGDELGRPFLLERTIAGRSVRLLYVPDIRGDTIFVVDASTDRPIIASAISGRAMRTIDGTTILVRTLDAPASIAFVERDRRTLGFVSNFGNSTLAVIDVSDPDPRRHRVVARLGRIQSPDETEEQR